MPKMELSCILTFSAAHFLTDYEGDCEKLHGHNYKVIITIKDKQKKNGMIMDFKIIKKITKEKILNKLDHSNLNDFLKNPSVENLCILIWEKLKNDLPLNKITIYETENCFCTYKGEN